MSNKKPQCLHHWGFLRLSAMDFYYHPPVHNIPYQADKIKHI